jgi:hypothetical protein
MFTRPLSVFDFRVELILHMPLYSVRSFFNGKTKHQLERVEYSSQEPNPEGNCSRSFERSREDAKILIPSAWFHFFVYLL